MRNKPTLTASDVQKMVAACKSEAAKNKWGVSIAVVDDAGYLLYLERLDGAGPVTAEVATEKAVTAARTRRPTKFWEDRLKERPAFMRKWVGAVSTVTLLLLALGTETSSQNHGQPLSFGVIIWRSPILTAQFWNPIIRYVSEKSGVPLQLKVAQTGPEHTAMSASNGA